MVTPVIVPITVETDLAHGGRWTSLRAGGREWLWSRDDADRSRVLPGDPFVDVGGFEECIPTIRGVPDHGDAWSRPWRRSGGRDVVQTSDFRLSRTFVPGPSALRVEYTLNATPGYRFLWAGHALLDVSDDATLQAPAGRSTHLFPEAAAVLEEPWPDGATHLTGTWPAPYGVRLDRFGPADGTAIGAVITDCAEVTVCDGADSLSFSMRASDAVPLSTAIWRNLGGFPPAKPYRSIGVEPLLGTVLDLAEAGPDDAAVVPRCGELSWELTLVATGANNP